eukprot:gnl/TRDRNA2_/TRDRNA2_153729_c0_seq2.p1 gnl/TRDRNA2_/TRDRNA2_153729_c0~~gnl/TRDRNA2_/TRDRNA2_153729_c0_seq2.p1  ORF type:complete len:514 (+),score=53.38 gnl/TRDRNA2_/TRDRNA2_153729_c0_seq2:1-1542(+)
MRPIPLFIVLLSTCYCIASSRQLNDSRGSADAGICNRMQLSGFTCGDGAHLNQAYIYQGDAWDGRPFYRGETSNYAYLYHDTQCHIPRVKDPAWILGGKPFAATDKQLDVSSHGCHNQSFIYSTDIEPPLGEQNWDHLWCAEKHCSGCLCLRCIDDGQPAENCSDCHPQCVPNESASQISAHQVGYHFRRGPFDRTGTLAFIGGIAASLSCCCVALWQTRWCGGSGRVHPHAGCSKARNKCSSPRRSFCDEMCTTADDDLSDDSSPEQRSAEERRQRVHRRWEQLAAMSAVELRSEYFRLNLPPFVEWPQDTVELLSRLKRVAFWNEISMSELHRECEACGVCTTSGSISNWDKLDRSDLERQLLLRLCASPRAPSNSHKTHEQTRGEETSQAPSKRDTGAPAAARYAHAWSIPSPGVDGWEQEAKADDEDKVAWQSLGKHLATLELPAAGATAEEVRRAYLRLALQYHPDKRQDCPEAATKRFHEISEAHEALLTHLKGGQLAGTKRAATSA